MPKQIPLTKGKFTTVDNEDYDMLMRYRWQCAVREHTCYAVTDINRERIYMHRMIMDTPPSILVDHEDGNGLNNLRSNLRLASYSQNGFHRLRLREEKRSKYRGVFLVHNKRSWFAQIVIDRKAVYLGSFRTQRDAAIAYNDAALKHHGEFAVLNVVPDDLDPDDIPFPEPEKPTNQYKGVKKQRRGGWSARTSIGDKELHLGTYPTAEEAARVRDAYVIEHSLNRPLNFP